MSREDLFKIFDETNEDALGAFLESFYKTFKQLESSGCFADDTPRVARANIALKLTGENVRIAHFKHELANARNFV